MADDNTQMNILTEMSGKIGELIGGVHAIRSTQVVHGNKIDILRTDVDGLKNGHSSNSIKKPSIVPASWGNGKTALTLKVIQVVGPWLIIGLVGLGVYLGAGGDTARTQEIIQRLERKIDVVQQSTDSQATPKGTR